MVITALTRNQLVGESRHVGSNPTLSAKRHDDQFGTIKPDDMTVKKQMRYKAVGFMTKRNAERVAVKFCFRAEISREVYVGCKSQGI